MKAQLTDVSVRALVPSDKQIKVWDTRTRGFGIIVSGHTKTWFVMFGFKRQLKTLGRYPDISLADARKKAVVAMGEQLGDQPAGTVQITFPEARAKYLDASKARVKPRTHAEMTRQLTCYFIWEKPLHKITHDDVATAVEAIKAPSEALHAFKNIRTFFNWCVPRYLKYSPVTGLKPPSRYIPRTRALTEGERNHATRQASVVHTSDDDGFKSEDYDVYTDR